MAGCFTVPRRETVLEGKSYIVTWGLGHLVTLKDPEGYDKKYKEWKMEELPDYAEKTGNGSDPNKTAKQFQTVKRNWYCDRMSKKS